MRLCRHPESLAERARSTLLLKENFATKEDTSGGLNSYASLLLSQIKLSLQVFSGPWYNIGENILFGH